MKIVKKLKHLVFEENLRAVTLPPETEKVQGDVSNILLRCVMEPDSSQ